MGNIINAEEKSRASDLDSSCDTTMYSVSVATSRSNLRDDVYATRRDDPAEMSAAAMAATSSYYQGNIVDPQHDSFSSAAALAQSQYAYAPPHGGQSSSHFAGPTDRPRAYYQQDCNESPPNYSDPSTDGDSMTSDAYRTLLHKDYLNSNGDGQKQKQAAPAGRKLPAIPPEGASQGAREAATLDLNLDFTLHVGKLVVYMKRLKLNIGFVEDLIGEVTRLRGRIKCVLLTPEKTQRYSTGVFEATPIDQAGNIAAELDSVFVFYLFPRHQIDGMALQFKLCGSRALFRDIMMAESFVRLGEINLTSEMLPVSVTFLDLGSTRFTEHHQKQGRKAVLVPKSGKLEVLLSLQYIPQTSSLVIDVKQSTRLGKLRDIMSREIILQAEVISATCECLQRKTTFLKMTIDNPGCNKPFEFNMSQDQLYVHTLMLSVSYSAARWNHQEKIGWISFGKHCSGQLEANHWDDMIRKSALHEAAVQWHCLCENQPASVNPLMKMLK